MILISPARAESYADTYVKGVQHFDHPAEVKRGTLLFKGENNYTSAPVLHMDVQFNITGMVARAHVKQKFTNLESTWQEGVYVFPLPEDAAVDHMRMQIGERIIEGQIKEKRQAKQIYTQARKNGKKAGLVEQERPNIFTTSVANIGPKESIVVEIEYQQIIKYDLGNFSLRFPMVVAPRYIAGNTHIEGFSGSGWASNTDQVPDAARITPPVMHPDKGKINPVSININLDSGFKLGDITSPYHAIDVSRPTDTRYQIRLAQTDVPADRDFVLNWQAIPGNGPKAALFRQAKDANDYALVMVLPPDRKQSKILNREIIFVIDTSGSMAGTSIIQAKSALDIALNRLNKGDRFNIIQFNSRTLQLFHQSQTVTQSSIQQARAYIYALQAQGGTEMSPAIHAALRYQHDTAAVRQVVFLTDGSVGNENELFAIIEQQLGNSRLFTIGIGSAPNSHFMSNAARFGRGTHTYIGNTHEIRQKMIALFDKIERPVLSHIRIQWPDDISIESWPQKIPDLYQGEPLLVTVKARRLPKQIRVSGRIAGSDWQAHLSLQGGQQKPGISVLWARRKIAALIDQQRSQKEVQDLRKEIITTALDHHLVSKYTSLIAVDVTPSRNIQEPLHRKALPTNLPAGGQYDKVFGRMPATATPAPIYFLSGIFLLVIALLQKLGGIYNNRVKPS